MKALISLGLLSIFIYGIVLDFRFAQRLKRGELNSRVGVVPWEWRDIAWVILFFFIGGHFLGFVLRKLQLDPMSSKCALLYLNYFLQILTIGFLLFYVKAKYGFKIFSFYGCASFNPPLLILILKSYCAAVPLILAAALLSKGLTSFFNLPSDPQPIVNFIQEEAKQGRGFIWLPFACIVSPFLEEIFFRGFIYPAIKKYWKIVPSMILTSVFFGGLHLSVSAFLPIVVLGLVLNCLYEKTGSLWAPMLFHGFNNLAATLVVVFVMPHREMHS